MQKLQYVCLMRPLKSRGLLKKQSQDTATDTGAFDPEVGGKIKMTVS